MSFFILSFLGRLFDRVYLIKPVSDVPLSVRTCVLTYVHMYRMHIRTSIRPQKVSSISMKFVVYVEVDE